MISDNAAARLSILASSKLVVGSSSVRMPQLRQNVSAKASRITIDARTWRRHPQNEQTAMLMCNCKQ